jgi:hypothetical protein
VRIIRKVAVCNDASLGSVIFHNDHYTALVLAEHRMQPCPPLQPHARRASYFNFEDERRHFHSRAKSLVLLNTSHSVVMIDWFIGIV